jgi:hypothetical protein
MKPDDMLIRVLADSDAPADGPVQSARGHLPTLMPWSSLNCETRQRWATRAVNTYRAMQKFLADHPELADDDA